MTEPSQTLAGPGPQNKLKKKKNYMEKMGGLLTTVMSSVAGYYRYTINNPLIYQLLCVYTMYLAHRWFPDLRASKVYGPERTWLERNVFTPHY